MQPGTSAFKSSSDLDEKARFPQTNLERVPRKSAERYKNLTQQEFAAKLRANRKTLNNWEKGRTKPIGKFWREIRSLLSSHAV
jgi:DNA-binding transcriptional regulator YiaG